MDGEFWQDPSTWLNSLDRQRTYRTRKNCIVRNDDSDAHEDSTLLATNLVEGESTANPDRPENPSQVDEYDDLDTHDESFDDSAERSSSRAVLSELKLLNEMFQSGEISQSSYLVIQSRLLELLDEEEDH